nr:putative reverse transcriptase domain-containing protein [Tanacetum cinerariifolium]
MPLEGVHIDDTLQFVEEPVEIMEREIKQLKQSRIPLVKVRWSSRRGPKFTWEREDSFKKKYPHLFTNRTSSSTTRLEVAYYRFREVSSVIFELSELKARSWSIPSEDPNEEAAQQLFEQAPHSLDYVPRDHVPVFVPEFEHPEDLVPAKDEAPASLLPPGFVSPRTPPLLPIPLSTPSTSHRAGIPEAATPPRNRPLLATPRPGCEVRESSTAAARRPGPTMAHGVDYSYVETRL